MNGHDYYPQIKSFTGQVCLSRVNIPNILFSFGWTYTKIGTIQRRLAWPLRKDDTQNREAFHIFWHPHFS